MILNQITLTHPKMLRNRAPTYALIVHMSDVPEELKPQRVFSGNLTNECLCVCVCVCMFAMATRRRRGQQKNAWFRFNVLTSQ